MNILHKTVKYFDKLACRHAPDLWIWMHKRSAQIEFEETRKADDEYVEYKDYAAFRAAYPQSGNDPLLEPVDLNLVKLRDGRIVSSERHMYDKHEKYHLRYGSECLTVDWMRRYYTWGHDSVISIYENQKTLIKRPNKWTQKTFENLENINKKFMDGKEYLQNLGRAVSDPAIWVDILMETFPGIEIENHIVDSKFYGFDYRAFTSNMDTTVPPEYRDPMTYTFSVQSVHDHQNIYAEIFIANPHLRQRVACDKDNTPDNMATHVIGADAARAIHERLEYYHSRQWWRHTRKKIFGM